MRIAHLELRSPWILAPMAGVSEMPFRRLAFQYGAGLCPTELVSAEGLIRASARTLRYLRRDEAWEKPFSVQIFGGNPDSMTEAAKVAKDHGADIIDINMGCPVPKVFKNGAGCALMSDPARAAEIVERIAKATGLPVTAKIRSGIDSSKINCVEVGLALEAAGCAAIAIHPRTRAQGYAGRADWSLIRRLKEALRIPVIGNGDVKTVADAQRMLEETGCDAVMIGRGALGNPWLFRQLEGGAPPSTEERHRVVLEHFRAHVEFRDDPRAAVRQFRKHIGWYAKGLVGASAFRAEAMNLETIEEVERALDLFFSTAVPDARYASGQFEEDDGIDYRTAYG